MGGVGAHPVHPPPTPSPSSTPVKVVFSSKSKGVRVVVVRGVIRVLIILQPWASENQKLEL